MKTKNTILIIVLALASPFILFVGILAASSIEDLLVTQKAVEKYGKKMQPKSGMVFPEDTTFVKGHWVKNSIFQERYANWYYTSKEPFQFPEGVDVIIEEDDMDEYDEWFGRMFETNIAGATEYKEAMWMINGFVFEAKMLKTPEQYYLYLDSYIPRSSEREALKAKEITVE